MPTQLLARWAHLYSDDKAVSATVTCLHLAAIFLGGGAAVVADPSALQLAPRAGVAVGPPAGGSSVHRWVVTALGVIVVSGLLMMLADLTPTSSPVFWIKMGLTVGLVGNGYLRVRAARHRSRDGRGRRMVPARVDRQSGAVAGHSAGRHPPCFRGLIVDRNDCPGCPLQERREFLRDVGALLASALVAPLPIHFGHALAAAGDERTYPIPGQRRSHHRPRERGDRGALRAEGLRLQPVLPAPATALRWHPEDVQFQCPKHHSRYRPDGVFISGRATRGMDRFALRRDGGNLVVDLDQLFRQDRDAAAWGAAVVTL